MYSTFNRELLAAYQAVLHFKPQIEGRNVTLFSDHKPLSLALKKNTPMKSDIQQRYSSIITEYCHVVYHGEERNKRFSPTPPCLN